MNAPLSPQLASTPRALPLPAATDPRRPPRSARLLHIDPGSARDSDRLRDTRPAELPRLLQPGDLLVVNDAATLPASLHSSDGLELRLLGWEGGARWRAVVMGRGDWRQDTDDRPAPPVLAAGTQLHFGGRGELSATVEGRSMASQRLIRLRFDQEGPALWSALYGAGRPVQYSYMAEEVPLAQVQNIYADRPWAVEMPSAGRMLTWPVLQELIANGIRIRRLTHAAGLSATGDPALDARLPLPERYEIPDDTARAIDRTRAAGGRVVAAGTSVVRAIEGDALADRPGRGVTALRLTSEDRPALVDGLLSNVHIPGESHFELMGAFAPRSLLLRAAHHARGEGYLAHEFGDGMLILAG